MKKFLQSVVFFYNCKIGALVRSLLITHEIVDELLRFFDGMGMSDDPARGVRDMANCKSSSISTAYHHRRRFEVCGLTVSRHLIADTQCQGEPIRRGRLIHRGKFVIFD